MVPLGIKRPAERWPFYWFPDRGPITRREARSLDVLIEREQSKEELRDFKNAVGEFKGSK